MAKLAGARSLLAPSLANISSAVPHYQGRAPPVPLLQLLLLLLQVHQVPPLQDPLEEAHQLLILSKVTIICPYVGINWAVPFLQMAFVFPFCLSSEMAAALRFKPL